MVAPRVHRSALKRLLLNARRVATGLPSVSMDPSRVGRPVIQAKGPCSRSTQATLDLLGVAGAVPSLSSAVLIADSLDTNGTRGRSAVPDEWGRRSGGRVGHDADTPKPVRRNDRSAPVSRENR